MKNQKTIILLINNLEKEDFLPIVTYTKFKKNLLIIFDRKSTSGHNACCIDYLLEDFKSPQKIISNIKTWKSENYRDIAGIIGLDEEYKYAVSKKIADTFNLKFYSQNTINKISNKYLQLLELKKNNTNVPNFKIINKENDNLDIGFPNVSKPVYGIGSSFVCINENKDQLEKNVTYFKEKNTRINNQLILQEFISGEEYSCDFIVHKNNHVQVLRVVKKITLKEDFPFFEGFYLFNPDHMENYPFKLAQLENLCKKIATVFGINRGVCMVDFKFFDNKIFVIETTIRPGISQFIELMGELYGYTSTDMLIKQILKQDTKNEIPKEEGLVFYITTNKPGLIKKFDTSLVETNKDVAKIVKYYQPNQNISLEKHKCYKKIALGHIMVKNIAPEKIIQTIKDIRKNIYIEMEV